MELVEKKDNHTDPVKGTCGVCGSIYSSHKKDIEWETVVENGRDGAFAYSRRYSKTVNSDCPNCKSGVSIVWETFDRFT